MARLRAAALVHDVGRVAGPGGDAALGARMASAALDPEQTGWIAAHERPSKDEPADGAALLGLARSVDDLRRGGMPRAELLASCRERFGPDALGALERVVAGAP